MSELPCDILCNILIRLPAKLLFRLRAVCRYWKRTIDDPLFVKLHTKTQQSCGAATILIQKPYGGRLYSLSCDRFNYSDSDADAAQDIAATPLNHLIHPGLPRLAGLPVHSCNGLILIPHHDIYGCWAIWNPLTRDFHQVKRSPNIHPPFKSVYTVRKGFGYDEASNDYKVIRVDRMYCCDGIEENDKYRTLVYSLKSPCWREIEGFPGSHCLGEDCAFLGGALHWRLGDGIISLHLGREDHHMMAAPPLNGGRYWNGNLYALDGCLMLNHGYRDCHGNGMDVWVMNDYGTDKQAWTKLFSVVARSNMRVLAYLKSKRQVLLQQQSGNSSSSNCLKWLDIEDKSVKEFTISTSQKHAVELSFCQFVPESLVRLGSTKSGGKRKRKKDDDEGLYATTGKKVAMCSCESSNSIVLPGPAISPDYLLMAYLRRFG